MESSDQLRKLKSKIIKGLKRRNIHEFEPNQLEMASSAGTGGSGAKANVHWIKLGTGELVAVKCLSRHFEKVIAGDDDLYEVDRKKRLLQYFERECALLNTGSKESHDCRFSKIVRLLGFAESYNDSLFPCLVMELYPEGDLRSFISRNRTLPEKERVKLLMDAASGLAYLHEPDLLIVHRDIKGSNIMVKRLTDGSLSAAIGDFGSAKLMDNRAFPIVNSSFTVSVAWTPPEYIVNGNEDYSNPTIFGDVWSFACTFLEVMSDSNPWLGTTNIIRCLSGEIPPPHPPRPRCFKEESCYWRFVRSCFLPPPEGRPTGRILETKLKQIYDNS